MKMFNFIQGHKTKQDFYGAIHLDITNKYYIPEKRKPLQNNETEC